MIMADSFCQNAKARANEFSTTSDDLPLVVQFAAKSANDFVDATTLLYPYADGVDLNCGCPQRWAIHDGYGCALLETPEVIFNLVRNVKNQCSSNFSVSVKLRIFNDLKKTIAICQQLENCGVTFLTVHGRTPAQKSSGDVNFNALQDICKSVQIPIVANGGIRSLEESDSMFSEVGCSGVMAASGLLTNPALFAGEPVTPMSCVRQWMKLRLDNPKEITFQCYHHHLVFMLEKVLSKNQKKVFNNLKTFESVDNYLNNELLSEYNEPVILYSVANSYVACNFSDQITSRHSQKCRGCSKSLCYCVCTDKYDANNTDGRFFSTFVDDSHTSEVDYFECAMFNEIG